ncbi:MAG: calcium-binding protein, partial [Rickettsiales bacterium]|nr:calcium-binding protein [Rickettsiales bacterium]
GGLGRDYMRGDAGTDLFIIGVEANQYDVINSFAPATTADKVDISAFSDIYFDDALSQVSAHVYVDLGNGQEIRFYNVNIADFTIDNFIGMNPGSGVSTSPTLGNDSITGTAAADIIDALAGDDTLNGGDGNDYLSAGLGNDSVTGGDGNDTIADVDLYSSTIEVGGDDYLYGNNGNDSLVSTGGNDHLFGGSGNDEFMFLPYNGSLGAVAEDFIQGEDIIYILSISGSGTLILEVDFSTLNISESGGDSNISFANGSAIQIAGVTGLTEADFYTI